MTVYLANIGNTHTSVAVCADGAPSEIVRGATAAVGQSGRLPGTPDDESFRCVACCVVPAARAALTAALGERIRFVRPVSAGGVDFSRVDTSTLGADRVANALAALEWVGPPVIVLDCGTALTTEAVDRDGFFRGGAIAPGRELLRRALHDYTGQLPLVPMAEDLPHALGNGTVAAIRAGVDLGARGCVARLLRSAADQLAEPRCPVVVTGGDADFFLPEIEGAIRAPRDFTLCGVAVFLRNACPEWQ